MTQKRKNLPGDLRVYYPMVGKTVEEARSWLAKRRPSIQFHKNHKVWLCRVGQPCFANWDPGRLWIVIKNDKIAEIRGWDS